MEEVSDDLLTFHEVVNHMQEMEEEIIDDHKAIIDVSNVYREGSYRRK